MKEESAYALEDLREFFIRRTWFYRDGYFAAYMSEGELGSLRQRTLRLPANRVALLRAFIEGYKLAKQ